MKPLEINKGEFYITTDPNKLDVGFIHHFLAYESSWSAGIALDKVEQSIKNSLNFGLFKEGQQIGYARVISDYSTIAYLGDVFVISPYRGQGLSSWLMDTVVGHKDLQGLRRWILVTSTAPWLYKKYGFQHLTNPDSFMEKLRPSDQT